MSNRVCANVENSWEEKKPRESDYKFLERCFRVNDLNYANDADLVGLKIFIGGLSHETTDSSLGQYFKKFGQISSAEVMRDRHTLSSRGFGFVTFLSETVALDVIELGRRFPHTIDGKHVDVKIAVPKDSTNRNHLRFQTQQARSYSVPMMNFQDDLPRTHELVRARSLGYLNMRERLGASRVKTNASYTQPTQNSAKDTSPTSTTSWSSTSATSMYSVPGSKGSVNQRSKLNSKIFVGGLLYATGHDSLRRYFEQFGELLSAEVIYNRETKRSRGFGFVIFRDPSMVNAVLRQQTKQPLAIDGKQIEVKMCKAKEQCMADQILQNGLLNSLRNGDHHGFNSLRRYQSQPITETSFNISYQRNDDHEFLSETTLQRFTQMRLNERLPLFEEKMESPCKDSIEYFTMPKELS